MPALLAKDAGMDLRPVLVIWEDASDADSGPWVHVEGMPEAEPVIFQQLGFLVKLTSTEVVLTQAVGKEQIANRTRIPAGMIRRIVEVKEGTPIAIPKKRKR